VNAVAASVVTRPIRVLHLRDSPWIDGPGRTILETGAHIDASRVEYHIGAFVSNPDEVHPLVAAARQRGIHVHEIRDRGGLDAAVIERIVALLRELQIDVLHTSEFRSSLIAMLCRRRHRVRLVCTAHGWIANDLRGRLFRWADKILLRQFDAVILVSRAMRRLVPRWWLPDRRVTVLLNALVLDAYGADVVRQPRVRRDVSRGGVLVSVGRLSPEKGQDLLLAAIAELAPRYPELRLKIAGIGPLEGALRARAEQLGIANRVEFLGYVKDMPRLYSEVDLVVQSSFTEGLPNVIVEAAYLRVPIVATEVGGTAEVIEHERSGWLIAPRSLAQLRDGIERFHVEPARFAAMGDAAHVRIREQFSFDARTDKLMQFYERLLAEHV
jgi:glycosyltransferase involved in cell wall biosynthesis